LLKTTTTAISPINITQTNSTKNKLIIAKKSKNNIIKEDSIRTRARKFIQNDLSAEMRQDSQGNKRELLIYTKQKHERESSEGNNQGNFSDSSFWTEGADQSHYDRYLIGKRIGQGAYAVVRAGIDTLNNQKVAIKIYNKLNLLDTQRRKGVRREIKILERLKHDNIVCLHEAFDNKKQVFLVMEYTNGGSLHSLLKSRANRQLKDDEARKLFKQIASALKYCHSKNITHRDIKLENVLLDESHEKVKIIDFGFSTWIPNETKIKLFCGTPSYMAPEIVSK